ncbi:putative fimbrial-like adhesin protein [Escherichia coli]|nr:putative fimbrial-like adhesin protein [Escherichia coli]
MLLMKTSPFTGHYCHRQPVASAVVKTIEVEFRDLIIDDINGNYGRKEVPYELTCDSTTRHPDWEMTLTWTGTQTSF